MFRGSILCILYNLDKSREDVSNQLFFNVVVKHIFEMFVLAAEVFPMLHIQIR